MATITAEMKVQINELYKKIGTYSGVARELGISPSTVKRYVLTNYTPAADLPVVPANIPFCRKKIESFVLSAEEMQNPDISKLTAQELSDMEEFWKELAL